MDYRLPGMDGVEATAAVLAAYPGAAVIGLTASANPRERQALSEAGAVACLSKHDELDEIVAAIQRAGRPTYRGRRGADLSEHRDRGRFDCGFPGGAATLSEL